MFSSSSGLKSVFENLRFREGLVWTVGLTVEIELPACLIMKIKHVICRSMITKQRKKTKILPGSCPSDCTPLAVPRMGNVVKESFLL